LHLFLYLHCSDTADEKHGQSCLRKEERAAFVKVVLKLLDRGQYSKDDSLAETVSIATSILSYVEPGLVLPFVATNFQLALETVSLYNSKYALYFRLLCSGFLWS
jgi:proteasome activator subunit 4